MTAKSNAVRQAEFRRKRERKYFDAINAAYCAGRMDRAAQREYRSVESLLAIAAHGADAEADFIALVVDTYAEG